MDMVYLLRVVIPAVAIIVIGIIIESEEGARIAVPNNMAMQRFLKISSKK